MTPQQKGRKHQTIVDGWGDYIYLFISVKLIAEHKSKGHAAMDAISLQRWSKCVHEHRQVSYFASIRFRPCAGDIGSSDDGQEGDRSYIAN